MRNILFYNIIFTSGLDKNGCVLSDAAPAGSYSVIQLFWQESYQTRIKVTNKSSKLFLFIG